jgi:hypothetical protein
MEGADRRGNRRRLPLQSRLRLACAEPHLDQQIHLSVVATSRNDNHGGSLTHRMQHFVNGFVAQCKRHGLRAELILVEWNPPADRVSLAEELRWPADPGPCDIRIVTVPRDVHARFTHADKIPLYQMIAKNVGIRRARGTYVLATNIDILFSDAAIQYMRDQLMPDRLYRAYRVDIPAAVPETGSFSEVLQYCSEQGFRIHGIASTAVRKGTKWHWRDLLKIDLDARVVYLLHLLRRTLFPDAAKGAADGAAKLQPKRLFQPWAFTNACGDFTLLARADWFRLRGYLEKDVFSWHLDSLFVLQALGAGCRQTVLGRNAPVYHIEHGRGYTPEGAAELFSRLSAQGVPFLADSELERVEVEIAAKRRSGSEVQFNEATWGMASEPLPETQPLEARIRP